MIEITSDAIERVATLLADVPKGAERVFANAMNRGISRAKTQALKRTKQVYTVNNNALTAKTTMKMGKASTGNLAGFVSFAGTKLPLYQYHLSTVPSQHHADKNSGSRFPLTSIKLALKDGEPNLLQFRIGFTDNAQTKDYPKLNLSGR